MAKREFLQLAHPYNSAKHHVAGWFMSEKLDGIRAFWDGGISRGLLASDVPWANVEKDFRLRRPPIATGLWSRYGKVIHAPDWWLDELPEFQLDGELWAGRGLFQKTSSIIKDHVPGLGWRDVKFAVIDCPPITQIFGDGDINNTNFKKRFRGCVAWAENRLREQPPASIHLSFESTVRYLNRVLVESEYCFALEQEQLPFITQGALDRVNERIDEIVSAGGEGVILRRHVSSWMPERTHNCLKLKPYSDAEGIVESFVWGRETDKGSKLLGMMGALVLRLDNGKRLELSGFTDAERQVNGPSVLERGKQMAGQQETDPAYSVAEFPVGSRVTYKYRELTDDGLPKEARFFRKRTQLV